jgi:SNF2 family DNA or RNA helicase
MAQVVITTPEMLVTDDFVELTSVDWEVLVVDEAHRLKNHNSKLATNLRDRRFDFGYTLLLTGTPIQVSTICYCFQMSIGVCYHLTHMDSYHSE